MSMHLGMPSMFPHSNEMHSVVADIPQWLQERAYAFLLLDRLKDDHALLDGEEGEVLATRNSDSWMELQHRTNVAQIHSSKEECPKLHALSAASLLHSSMEQQNGEAASDFAHVT